MRKGRGSKKGTSILWIRHYVERNIFNWYALPCPENASDVCGILGSANFPMVVINMRFDQANFKEWTQRPDPAFTLNLERLYISARTHREYFLSRRRIESCEASEHLYIPKLWTTYANVKYTYIKIENQRMHSNGCNVLVPKSGAQNVLFLFFLPSSH